MAMQSDFSASLVLIGSKLSALRFGTGFIIEQTGSATRIVTCQHVIDRIGDKNIENVRIGDQSRKVSYLGTGTDDAYDLAVIEVSPPIDGIPTFITSRECGPSITLEGFQETERSYMRLPLKGELRKRIGMFSRTTEQSLSGWQIEIEQGYMLEPGYSGSPVADAASGAVFGIVSYRGEGQKGLVLSLAGLPHIWTESANLLLENRIIVTSHPRDTLVSQQLVKALSEKLNLPVALRPWSTQPLDSGVLTSCKTLLVVWGEDLAGERNHEQLAAVFQSRIGAGLSVIPVTTSSGASAGLLGNFVPQNVWCSYTKDSDLNRVIWAITGDNPVAPEMPPAPIVRPNAATTVTSNAIRDIARSCKNGSLAFVVGCTLPPETDIVLRLTAEAGILPTFLPLDFAGSCYSISRSDDQLDEELRQLFGSDKVPDLYTQLCSVIRQGLNKPTKRLKTATRPQLVVTTNLDLLLEFALLQAGIPFLRVVQDRSCKRLHVSDFSREIADATSGCPIGEIRDCIDGIPRVLIEDRLEDRLDGQAQSPLQTLPLGAAQVVLYKLLGSAEIERSAVLTSEQLFAYVRALQSRRMTPIAIGNILANSDLVFIGYGHLDLSFRITQQLLPAPAGSNPRYLIQACPPDAATDPLRSLERIMWSGLKERRAMDLRTKTIEENPNNFISRLQSQLAVHP